LALRRRLELGIAAQVDITELIGNEGVTQQDDLEHEDLARALRTALSSLAPSDRLMLQLRFEADYSATEIARVLSLPTPFHVYRRLRVLLAGLRQTLGKGGFEGA
jgi:DNA-directed RNA polymerase specialized sigma subunit